MEHKDFLKMKHSDFILTLIAALAAGFAGSCAIAAIVDNFYKIEPIGRAHKLKKKAKMQKASRKRNRGK